MRNKKRNKNAFSVHFFAKAKEKLFLLM